MSCCARVAARAHFVANHYEYCMRCAQLLYLGQEYNSLPSKHPEQRRAVMAAKTKLKLSVLWGTRKLIAPSFYSFLNSDLQETTVRQLLINVVTVICR